MLRGEVWWADLPEPMGSGPSFRRPVLIVQADSYNRSRVSTVLVVAITGNLRNANAPGNVRLPAEAVGLPRDSVINVSQVLAIDRFLLTSRVGHLPSVLLSAVESGLRRVLQL